MKKIIPLIFSVLYAFNSNAQAVGGWGTCEFADVATMNAFNPSTNAYDCKKVFVQATNNHYYWNGTIWVLVQDTDTDDQTLSLSSNTLSISEGNSVNLSSYLDNTDSQTLGLSGNTLSISGGNNVDLSGLADNLGNHTATTDLNMSTNDIDFSTGEIDFGTSTRQMINLWSTNYGIGVQGWTQYHRTERNFAWYSGGSHNNNELNNGGGSTMMTLNNTGLNISNRTTTTNFTMSNGAANGYLLRSDGSGNASWVDPSAYTNTDDQTASEVNITDAGGNFTSTNVEGALTELANATDENIYNTDGTLTTNRAVTTGNFDLNIDANTLVIDGSANRVGIGTNTPERALHVWDDFGRLSRSAGGISGLVIDRFESGTNNIFASSFLGIESSAVGTGELFLANYNEGVSGLGFSKLLSFNIANNQAKFDTYGSGTYTGTLSRILGVEADGDLIEVDAASLGTDDQTASEVNITDAGGNFTSTNVEGALTELANATDENIYNTDGTLTTNRAVTTGNFDLNIDANTLVIDGSANRVGIGTNTPETALQLGDFSNTNSSKIFLAGPNSNAESSEIIFNDNGDVNNEFYGSMQLYFNSSNNFLGISDFDGVTRNTHLSILRDNGRVGIGTESPDALLDVEGGNVRFSDYGSGTYSGTLSRILGVETDGDIIEVDASSLGTDDQTASEVNITDAGGNFTSTNVEGALTELANATDENIYNTDGTLTGDRELTLDGNDLTMKGTSDVVFKSDGKIGLGINLPLSPLHINANGTGTNGIIKVEGTEPDILFNDTNGGFTTFTFQNAGTSQVAFGKNNANDFYITRNSSGWQNNSFVLKRATGNVGIGTDAPDARLDIDGGTVKFSDYGTGTNTGTQTFLLAVDADGDVIETPLVTNTDDQTASEVNITDAGGNFTSTNVEGALTELANATDENIYNTDGTLTSTRAVTTGNFDLNIDANTLVVDGSANRVGIGLNNPSRALSLSAGNSISLNGGNVTTNTTDGLFWHNSLTYGIYRSSGSWTGPDYEQLTLDWPTGIVLNPGTLYGKSFVDVQGEGLKTTKFAMSNGAANGYLLQSDGSGNASWVDPTAFTNTDDQTASEVNITDAGGNFTSTNVEGALTELANATDENIYNTDGTLTGNRAVTTGNFDLNVDANTLVVDGSANRVGIGTNAPDQELDVAGNIELNDYLIMNGKRALQGSDTWLRLNQNSQFTSGIYSPSFLRIDNAATFNEGGGNYDFRVEGDTDQNLLRVDASSDRIGIGTGTPASKLTIGNNLAHDASFDYSEAQMTIFDPTDNGGNSPAAARDILHLVREGVNGQAYGNKASFALSRYENNSTNSRTQLDIKLTEGSFNAHNNIMSLRSNGRVGIGTTTPAAQFDVDGGTVKFSDYGTGTNTGTQTFLLAVDADGDVIETPLVTNTDDQTASEVNITDAGGNFTSTNVEGALAELANADDDNIYNTDGALGEDREVTLDGNDLTFKGSSDVIIQADGDVGIGTAGPSGRLHATNTTDRNGFMFESSNGLTGEKDVFTIQDNDTGGGGQDHSSVLKVHKNANINNSDEGFSLIELANTGTNPNGNEYWISGRKTDEGAPEWGVQISDNEIWSSGGILLNATGAANGTYSGGDFIVESGGDVGIGTISPDAKLDVEGGTVRFSDYGAGTNSGTATRLLAVDADGDVIETPLVTNTDAQNLGLAGTNLSITGGNTVNLSGLADNLGNHTATTDLNMSTNDIDFTTGDANFGSSTRQMVNLYSTSYGIGIQSSTQYYRTGNHFAWYRGGSHNNSALNNGGGSTMMILNSSGNLGLGGINPSYKLQVSEGTNTSASITTTSEAGDATLYLGTPFSGSAGAQKTAIIAEGQGSWSRAKLHFALNDNGTDNSTTVNAGISDSKMTIQYNGNVGIGTTTPDARLDVEGGSVRFTDYGSGTYDNTSTATHILGVQADGDVVEMNTATNSRIFYPPAIAIEADAIVVDETLDLHQTYVNLFGGGGSTFVSSTSAPGSIPTYDQDELYYYILDYDTAVFANVTIDANGLMEYDVIAPASGDCSFINIVFVVK